MFAVSYHCAGCIPDSDFYPVEDFETAEDAWQWVLDVLEEYAYSEDSSTRQALAALDKSTEGVLEDEGPEDDMPGFYRWEVFEYQDDDREESE